MVHLGIDFGTVNIGLALSDEEGRFAIDLPILKNKEDRVLADLKRICEEKKVELIVLGLPGLQRDNPITRQIKDFSKLLSEATQLDIKYWDESYTSIWAESGLRGKRKKQSDSKAARIILQEYLDFTNSRQ
jgi:putative transcription antitermination factor YqgF